jgi:hypothetical protein
MCGSRAIIAFFLDFIPQNIPNCGINIPIKLSCFNLGNILPEDEEFFHEVPCKKEIDTTSRTAYIEILECEAVFSS